MVFYNIDRFIYDTHSSCVCNLSNRMQPDNTAPAALTWRCVSQQADKRAAGGLLLGGRERGGADGAQRTPRAPCPPGDDDPPREGHNIRV